MRRLCKARGGVRTHEIPQHAATKSPDNVTSKCCQSWHSVQVILCYVKIRTEYQIKCVLMKGNGTDSSVENHSHFVFIIGVMGRRSFANPLSLCWKCETCSDKFNAVLHVELNFLYLWMFHLIWLWIHICGQWVLGFMSHPCLSTQLQTWIGWFLRFHRWVCYKKSWMSRKADRVLWKRNEKVSNLMIKWVCCLQKIFPTSWFSIFVSWAEPWVCSHFYIRIGHVRLLGLCI